MNPRTTPGQTSDFRRRGAVRLTCHGYVTVANWSANLENALPRIGRRAGEFAASKLLTTQSRQLAANQGVGILPGHAQVPLVCDNAGLCRRNISVVSATCLV
jgi:hypothetical protein